MLEEGTALNVVALGTDQTSNEIVNFKNRGIIISTVVSNAGTGSIDGVEIHVADGDGGYKLLYTLAFTSAITANGSKIVALYPQASLGGSFDGTPVVGVLPRRFKIVTSHANSNVMTYKVSYQSLA